MKTPDKLQVYMDGMLVGTMAPYQRFGTAFEYSSEWLQNGYSISPFSLPLNKGVRIAKPDPFDGIFGVFADSLPDGWGRLLMDRMMRREGIRPEETDHYTCLSIIGTSGKGALEYQPVYEFKTEIMEKDLDRLAEESGKILRAEESSDLDSLFALGGSSGGARPKVILPIDQEEWIIKFPSSADPEDAGLMEYEYMKCAQECGIETAEPRLFPSRKGPGYYGSKRFDRIAVSDRIRKIHMVSVSGLLEISHRIPSLDYHSLMALTWQLTKQFPELERMYRLMCFNVFAHNRDDHSNNFSFLFKDNKWQLAPAYDLTYSSSLGGEHATTINGEGRNPSMQDLLKVAEKAGIKEREAVETAEMIWSIVNQRLGKYIDFNERGTG